MSEGEKEGDQLNSAVVMKPARAVTSRAAGDVYGAHRALPFGGKAKHNMRHGVLKFSPARIMLTLTQIWEGFED